jgi:hypothetical protein
VTQEAATVPPPTEQPGAARFQSTLTSALKSRIASHQEQQKPR